MKKILKSAAAILLALSLAACDNQGSFENVSDGSSINENSYSPSEQNGKSDTSGKSDALNSDGSSEQNDASPAYVSWMLEDKVHEIRITMADEDWKAICANPYNSDYHAADVSIDGVFVTNVGVRTRGHGTLYTAAEYYPDSHKYPFKIKFDKYEKDQTFLGLDELALNNGGDDFSMMRDYMGYEAFRLMGSDASCVSFFNVYINDELRGFYIGIEAIDTSYLERMFGSHKKNLYEGENGATLSRYMPMSYLTQKKGKDETKDDIKQLISVIDSMPLGEKGDIESVLDVDSVLRIFAVNAVLDNRDGYGGIFAHNYYLYNPDGRFVMLPWDMNAPFVSYATDIESPTVGVYGYSQMNERPLAKKLMAVEEYYAKYLDYCRQLAEKLPELKEDVLHVYELIKESVENDPNKFTSSYYFNTFFDENRYYGTVYFLTKRYDYVLNRVKQLEGKPISEAALNPPPPPPPRDENTSGSDTSSPYNQENTGSDADENSTPQGEYNQPSDGESQSSHGESIDNNEQQGSTELTPSDADSSSSAESSDENAV